MTRLSGHKVGKSTSMKCPTKCCNGAVHRTTEWDKNDHCEYVRAICNSCLGTYWLVKRKGRFTLSYRSFDEVVFEDHREAKR